VHIRLLGSVEITDGERLITVGPKERRLLALLAVHANAVVSGERISDALWAGDPPRTATKTLQGHVSRLRRALGDAAGFALMARPPGYVLRVPTGATDVAIAEGLAGRARREAASDPEGAEALFSQALACWRGPALGEFASESFAQAESCRLEELRLAIIEEKISTELAMGRDAELTGELESLCATHPLRERLWALRMVALYRCGRQADALRVYQDLRRQLDEELGIQPSAEVRHLEVAILQQAPELDWERPHPPPTEPTTGRPGLRQGRLGAGPCRLPPVAALAASGFFVGRAEEVDRLMRAWKGAAAGARRAVLVAGEPGVGKTRLVAEAARVAHADGALVLWGRCDEELAVGYQPFAEALRQWVSTAGPSAMADLAGRAELGRLLPELGHAPRPVGAGVGLGGDPEGARLVFFEAVAQLVRDLADARPVLVVLDDLHWASAPTLRLLRYLIREPVPAALLVIGTYRDSDVKRTHPLAGKLAELRREPNVDRVELRGLGEADVVEFVEAAGGLALDEAGTGLASAIFHRTEGNPFFIGQVLDHLSESGALVEVEGAWRATAPIESLGIPEGVREVIGYRLSRLPQAANQALIIGAVAGPEFELRTLEELAGPDDPDAWLGHVEEAVDAHLLDEVPDAPGWFAFPHVLVRQTLLAELTAPRRARLHHRIGEALAGRPGASAAAVAHHLVAGASAKSIVAALPWVERAMDEAWGRAAYEEAAAIGTQTLEALHLAGHRLVAERCKLLIRTARSTLSLGDIQRGEKLAEEAISIARGGADPTIFAEAVWVRFEWTQIGVPYPYLDAGRLMSEALEGLGEKAPALRARLLALRAAYRGLSQGEGSAAEPEARQAVELARQSGDYEAQHNALVTLASVGMGNPAVAVLEGVLQDLDRLLDSAPTEENRVPAVLNRARVAVVARLVQGDRAGAEAAAAQVGELARRGGVGRWPGAFAGMWQGMFDLADGRLDSAATNAAAMLPVADIHTNFRASWVGLTFRIDHERGAGGACAPLIWATAQQNPGLAVVRAVLALALIDAGEVEEARSRFAELARDGFAAVPRDSVWSTTLSNLAEVCLALGDPAAAGDLYALLLPFAGQVLVATKGVYCPGAADSYLGALAGLCGRGDEITERFTAALKLEESMGTTALAARTRVWWAGALADRGWPADIPQAKALIEEALSAAEPAGLAAIRREAEQIAVRFPS
jgi:DNA-binding SARP family transcriptional activator/tetratricopeptide (TPR) repeat protein